MTPSNALPEPVTAVGLLRRLRSCGEVIDIPWLVTEVASQIPPLLLPSRRLNVTIMVPLTARVFFTLTTASTSCCPPPLTIVAGELGFHLRRFVLEARACAVWVALSRHGWWPWLTSCWAASA